MATRRSAGFTLCETIIAMSLSLIAVGLIVCFIVFTVKLNARTKAAAERGEQFTRLREHIDIWFSSADKIGYTIELGGNDYAAAVYEDDSFEIAGYIAVGNGCVTFDYGFNGGVETVSCNEIQGIAFYEYGDDINERVEGAVALRFTVRTFVNGGLYACELLC